MAQVRVVISALMLITTNIGGIAGNGE